MSDNETYYTYTVEREDENLYYLSNYFYNGEISADFLLNFRDNKNRIFSFYNDEEKFQYKEAQVDFIKQGTVLDLPLKERKFLLEDSLPQEYQKIGILELDKTFWTEKVKQYLDKRIKVLKQNEGEEYLIKRMNTFYVKVWSRILKKVIYLTPYLDSFNISVTADGGNFSFSLPSIAGEFDGENWKMINIQEFDQQFNNGQFFSKTNVVYNYDLNVIGGYKKTFSNFYFEKILNPQDLIFIKLDEPFLKNEELDFEDDYDMICTIDSVKPIIIQNENNIEASVKISGRDLMKLFIEDGTYYFPIEFYVGDGEPKTIFDRADTTGAKRIFGKLFSSEIFMGGTISKWLEFILKNLQVTDWDIPTKNGIWDWIEFKYEEVAGKRWILKNSIATMSGSIINYIRQLADYPFVELIGDTFGKYNIILRTPPFSKKMFLENRRLEISIKHLVSNETGIDDKNIRSWFWLKPEAYMMGGNNDVLMATFFPVYFSKLARIFGSKKMEQIHKYAYFRNVGEKNIIDSKLIIVDDVKWLIECFLAEPFMKKGTLTFKNVTGIKVGINIYIPEIDMIYYVKGYSHTIGISERVTTVQVERGMPLSSIDLFYNLAEIKIDEEKNQVTYAKLNEDVLEKLMKKNYF